jgi:predicted N-acetyltransferase YhbS
MPVTVWLVLTVIFKSKDMIDIRKANDADYPAIENVIERAFSRTRHSGYNEHFPLTEVRHLDIFIPELSLVAEIDNREIVGHIYMIKTVIGNAYSSLGLAQVAVVPEYRQLTIGSLLIETAHQKARELGYGSVVSLGFKEFLSHFGYKALTDYGIYFPYGVVEDQCLVAELYPGALKEVKGLVSYPLELL